MLANRISITLRILQKLFNNPSIVTQQFPTISRALSIDLFHLYTDSLIVHNQTRHMSSIAFLDRIGEKQNKSEKKP